MAPPSNVGTAGLGWAAIAERQAPPGFFTFFLGGGVRGETAWSLPSPSSSTARLKGGTTMLMEKASVGIDQNAQNAAAPSMAPVSTGALYRAGKSEIYVPVYLLMNGLVFAPPFLIPQGEWTVVFELQVAGGLVFNDISYSNQDSSVIINNDRQPGTTTWTTTFNTTQVTKTDKLSCTIQLTTSPNTDSNGDGQVYSGDPTIAVVQDPMGG
jgi:hypothetical protein